ncbi:DNA oxidative demethylase AlkB [Kozakia baliensis]|uniref:DNA oxidative demethylase AlkB n=1 Tax=Kozakia baliensis TaxID=153496 RepID=UPI000497B3AE|nr:DNA oxidative demethylase AlkB [Kozakia baliensis]
MNDLLSSLRRPERIGPDAMLLPGFALEEAESLVKQIMLIAHDAPFRRLHTPGGRELSAEMTNCGMLGWHSDRAGYRYESNDPLSGKPWPVIPPLFRRLAQRAARHAGHPGFDPQACLINRYATGARMGLHQDRDEEALDAPIVSVSLGVPAKFLFGGMHRSDPTQSFTLEHGDVVVWGGASRLFYHGVAPIKAATHSLTGALRYNLTFRRIRHAIRPMPKADLPS